MNHHFENYATFRNLGTTLVYIPTTGTTMCLHAVDADPHNTYVVASGVTWGLRAISQETKNEYFCWFNDKGEPVDKFNSICQAKAIDTILRRLLERKRSYRVSWHTTTSSNRSYTHDYETEAEAVKKARKVAQNLFSNSILVNWVEDWNEVREGVVWSCGSILATIDWSRDQQ